MSTKTLFVVLPDETVVNINITERQNYERFLDKLFLIVCGEQNQYECRDSYSLLDLETNMIVHTTLQQLEQYNDKPFTRYVYNSIQNLLWKKDEFFVKLLIDIKTKSIQPVVIYKEDERYEFKRHMGILDKIADPTNEHGLRTIWHFFVETNFLTRGMPLKIFKCCSAKKIVTPEELHEIVQSQLPINYILGQILWSEPGGSGHSFLYPTTDLSQIQDFTCYIIGLK